jgi:hypothetical protein
MEYYKLDLGLDIGVCITANHLGKGLLPRQCTATFQSLVTIEDQNFTDFLVKRASFKTKNNSGNTQVIISDQITQFR